RLTRVSGVSRRLPTPRHRRFPDTPHQTRRAAFTAPGFPGLGIPRPALPPGPYPFRFRPFLVNFMTIWVSDYSGRLAPAPLRPVAGSPALRLLWGLRRC